MTRTTKAGREAAAALSARFTRTEAWNGLAPGDAVKITGIRGGHWRYRCHVTNVSSGATWVEVAELDVPRKASGAVRLPGEGGEEGECRTPSVRRVRSFAEDRIVPLRRRRRRTATSLSEQGVLDLDLPAHEDPPAARKASPPRRRTARPEPGDVARLELWAGSEADAPAGREEG